MEWEASTLAGTSFSEKFHTHKVKHNGDMGMGHLWLKIADLQGSTLSNHRMTTHFDPFDLPRIELKRPKIKH